MHKQSVGERQPRYFLSSLFFSFSFLVWFDLIWFDLIWFDLIWFDLIWFDLIWFDLIWFDLIWFVHFCLLFLSFFLSQTLIDLMQITSDQFSRSLNRTSRGLGDPIESSHHQCSFWQPGRCHLCSVEMYPYFSCSFLSSLFLPACLFQ